MCGVPPPEKLAPCSENMCGVHPSRHTLFLCGVLPPPIQFCALNTLPLSWILSKIENLSSSSLQDEAKLNLYPRVWHSQLSLLFTFNSTCVLLYIQITKTIQNSMIYLLMFLYYFLQGLSFSIKATIILVHSCGLFMYSGDSTKYMEFTLTTLTDKVAAIYDI